MTGLERSKRASIIALTVALVLGLAAPSAAWDGIDRDTGDAVEIEPGELVRVGEIIFIFHWGQGGYKLVQVKDIVRSSYSVDITVFDPSEGVDIHLEMDDE